LEPKSALPLTIIPALLQLVFVRDGPGGRRDVYFESGQILR